MAPIHGNVTTKQGGQDMKFHVLSFVVIVMVIEPNKARYRFLLAM